MFGATCGCSDLEVPPPFQCVVRQGSNELTLFGEGTRALRRFALRQTDLATRPSTTHVDHSVSEIDVMPLQAQAFGYTETCAGGQKRQSAFRLSEVTHDCIRLFGGENHRFVSAGRLAADKAHGVRLLVSRN